MSKTRTIHGIDLTAPGGIEALLAHHRRTFGDAVMEAGEGDPAPAGDPAPNSDPAPTPAPEPQGDPKPAEPQSAEWDGKVESLPAGVQKMINDLRKDDGDERIAKKTLDAIQKAINPDAKGDEKPNAEQLTKDLAAREAATRSAQNELAVYKAASKAGADADALLDSRAFQAKIADLDPADAKAITKAITDAVTENPKFKLARAAGASSADFSGGSGEQRNKKSMSLSEATASHYGTK